MTDALDLVVLSAGAAKGVVEALAPSFRAETGAGVAGTFGAVGAIRGQFLARGDCDVLILTAAMLDDLARDGHVDRETIVPLGAVATGVAVRAGDQHPKIDGPAALRDCFARAQALYCPDTERATAGIHFVRVLRELGLWPDAAARIRAYPSGAIAMRALAEAVGPGLVGCTQVTEILYTPGVELVGTLPPEFALATTYAAAVAARAPQPELARRLVALLTGAGTAPLRARGGFSVSDA